MADQDDMVVALVGDCLIQHRLSVYKEERVLKLVDLLRGADISIGNLECNIQAGEDFPAFVAGGGHGATYMAAPPFSVEELQWFGFKTFFTANNHSQDFAEGGMVTTLKYLDAAGIGHAGTGRNLTEATAPCYSYTAKGRVAVIGAADWGPRGRADLPYPIPLGAMAGDEGPMFKGRPGVNLIRYDAVPHVDRATMDALRRASQEMGWEQSKEVRRHGGARAEPLMGPTMLSRETDTDKEFFFMGTKFMLDDRFTFETVPYQMDLERNFRWVREARRQSEVVIVGFHQQGASRTFDEPPDHTRIFARGAIDAGADVFVAHGSSRLGGIEIYNGKAIIYGVPGFIRQLNQVRHLPSGVMQRWGLSHGDTAADFLEARDNAEAGGRRRMGVGTANPGGGLAVYSPVFDKNKELKEVRVHPLEESSGTRPQRGRPMLAEPGSEVARAVLESVVKRSEAFGTKVEVRDGVAVARVK